MSHHYHLATPRTISEIQVDDFYKQFQLVNSSPLEGIAPRDLRFIMDGFGAAIALAERATGLDEHDQILKECLLRKNLSPKDLIVETFALPQLAENARPTRYQSLSEGLVSQFWQQVCGRLGESTRPIPVEVTSTMLNNDLRPTASIKVQFHQPTPLPFLPHHADLATFGPIPQSAIFFASRFHRLRQLSTKLHLAKEAKKSRPRQVVNLLDEEVIEHQIYQVLISSALYMAMMIGWSEGVRELGFGAEEWIVTYEMGVQQGGEMFGLYERLEVNGQFLMENLDQFTEWEEKAAQWWCPRDDQAELRHRVGTALADLQLQLLDIYKEMFKLRPNRNRQLRSSSPEHDPYSPTAR